MMSYRMCLVIGLVLGVSCNFLEAGDVSGEMGIEGEFASSKVGFGEKPRVRVVGLLGFDAKTAVEMALTYGALEKANALGPRGERFITLGAGIRREYSVANFEGLYFSIAGGVIHAPEGTGIFFQPKVGFAPELTSRITLDFNTAVRAYSLVGGGTVEQPFSMGLRWRIK